MGVFCVGKQKRDRVMAIYCAVALAALLAFNFLVYPLLALNGYTPIDYAEFTRLVEDGRVENAEVRSGRLVLHGSTLGGKGMYLAEVGQKTEAQTQLQAAAVESEATANPGEILLGWVLPIAVFVLIGVVIARTMMRRQGGGAMSFGKNTAKVYAQAQTGVRFADVAGQDEAKESLQEIVDFLNHPQRYADIGARLPKGALLVGPPGTGKTLLARAVAGEAGVPFFSISGSNFVEMFAGVGAARVRDLFKQAVEKAPCIVFIDEIDALGKRRNASAGSSDEREQTLNQLLSEMDGFDGSKGVVILAATNRPEILDRALLRPGRFDRRIVVDKPDLKGREAILRVHARRVKGAERANLAEVARATPGAAGADLANIINEAALRAVRQGRDEVTQADLAAATENALAGQERRSRILGERERRIVAYHETGHALISAFHPEAEPVHRITIVPRTMGALGYTLQLPEEERNLLSREAALAQIEVLLGGRAAEELVFGSMTSGAANDIARATEIARAMIAQYGMSEHFGTMGLTSGGDGYLGGGTSAACAPQTLAQVDEEVRLLLQQAYHRARKTVGRHEECLHAVAAALLDRETLSGEAFYGLVAAYGDEEGA